jgi:hypothetical protein
VRSPRASGRRWPCAKRFAEAAKVLMSPSLHPASGDTQLTGTIYYMSLRAMVAQRDIYGRGGSPSRASDHGDALGVWDCRRTRGVATFGRALHTVVTDRRAVVFCTRTSPVPSLERERPTWGALVVCGRRDTSCIRNLRSLRLRPFARSQPAQ